MANEITMRVGFEGAPGGDAALQESVAKAKAAQEEAARASERAAQEEAEHLKLIEAQYGQLGPAAAKAYGQARTASEAARSAVTRFSEAAKSGGEGVEVAAREAASAVSKLEAEIRALRAAGGDVTALEAALASLRAELKATAADASGVASAFRGADAAIERFETVAKKSVRGAAQAAISAKVEIEQLAAETNRLRDSGKNVEVYERRLQSLEARYRGAERSAAIFRRAQKDVDDEFKLATVRAGEVEGQISSLTDAIILKFPKAEQTILGFGASLLTLRTAYAETRQFVSFMKETFGVDIDAAVKQSLAGWFELDDRIGALQRRMLGLAGEEVSLANKTKILAAANIQHGESVAEVEAAYAKLTEGMQEQRQQIAENQKGFQALLEAAAGTKVDDLAAGVDILTKSLNDLGVQIGDTAIFGAKSTQDLEGALQKLAGTQAFPEFLERLKQTERQLDAMRGVVDFLPTEAREKLERYIKLFDEQLKPILQSVPALAADAVAALEKFGVKTPRDISAAIDSLLGFQAAVQATGRVTTEQAQIIRTEARRIVEAIDQMPVAAQVQFADARDALEALASSVTGFADVALASFGVKTPEAIERSITSIDGLIAAFGPLGKVTAEQAAVVVAELQKILDAISILPAEQRAAMAEQETAVRALADQYGEIAVRRKQYAEDIVAAEEKQLAREKEILAERQEMLSTFASAFEQLQSKLDGKKGGDAAAAEVEKLKTELSGLEDLAILTPEQVARMAELQDQIGEATVASAAFATGNQAASLSVEEVDDAVVGLIDSLKANKQAWQDLPLASQEAIANMVGRLQQAGQEGTATAATIEDAFLTVGQIITQAGGSLGELGTAIDRNAEGVLDLRREFGSLQEGVDGLIEGTGKLGEAQKDAATLAKERSELAVKAAEEEKAALDASLESRGKEVEIMERQLVIWERVLVIAKEYKECVASTGFA